MDSWAANDVNYTGVNSATIPNKAEPSTELQASGFVPTYFDANGNLVFGDGVSAQHMNYILNDLYQQIATLTARLNAGTTS